MTSKHLRRFVGLCCLWMLGPTGCATWITAREAGHDDDADGLRYFLAVPYLMVQQGQDGKWDASLQTLVDRKREFTIQPHNLLGKNKTEITFNDDGTLKTFALTQDTTAVSDALVTALGTVAAKPLDVEKTALDAKLTEAKANATAVADCRKKPDDCCKATPGIAADAGVKCDDRQTRACERSPMKCCKDDPDLAQRLGLSCREQEKETCKRQPIVCCKETPDLAAEVGANCLDIKFKACRQEKFQCCKSTPELAKDAGVDCSNAPASSGTPFSRGVPASAAVLNGPGVCIWRIDGATLHHAGGGCTGITWVTPQETPPAQPEKLSATQADGFFIIKAGRKLGQSDAANAAFKKKTGDAIAADATDALRKGLLSNEDGTLKISRALLTQYSAGLLILDGVGSVELP